VDIVIAPDKFKGTLGAPEAAEAIARGVRDVFPAASLTLRPMADGGEGTIDALLVAVGGRARPVKVHGALGDEVDATIGYLDDARAVVETAQAVGFETLPQGRRAPLAADSFGVGELVREVIESGGVTSLIVGIGGTASNDGGAGAARALGYRFFDRAGVELDPGGGALADLARIDDENVHGGLSNLDVRAATDVTNPLLGENGATRVFGPQKGATREDLERLEEGMSVLAERMRIDLGQDVARRDGAGAGGGLGAGLMAFIGASVESGFDLIADAAGLARALRTADYAITGEGRLDEQTIGGKTPYGVAQLAKAARVPCLAVAGEVPLAPRDLRGAGFTGSASLIETVGEERAWADTAGSITLATRKLLRAKSIRTAPGRRDRTGA
jgi:glycerate kinase